MTTLPGTTLLLSSFLPGWLRERERWEAEGGGPHSQLHACYIYNTMLRPVIHTQSSSPAAAPRPPLLAPRELRVLILFPWVRSDRVGGAGCLYDISLTCFTGCVSGHHHRPSPITHQSSHPRGCGCGGVLRYRYRCTAFSALHRTLAPALRLALEWALRVTRP
jgi:hypothetical protein